LRLLDSDIKRVSFDNIQNPHMDIATKLHGLREDLAYLRAEVGHMIRFTPPALVRYYNEGSDENQSYRPREDPVNSSQRIADDAAVLEQFLTDSLNLLIASIALRDSQRADMLTWLAAVYVPLSFVTGIFGMNLRELNDSSLPVWVCLEVLGVVLLVTAAMVVMYKLCVKYSGVFSKKPKRSLESGLY
jgi:Mg2+ and Co2+ transporter CorA